MVRIILISENMMGNKIGEENTGNRKRKGSIKKILHWSWEFQLLENCLA